MPNGRTTSPRPPKQFVVFTVRVYVIDGAYNGEMIDEFEYKASNIRGFGGSYVRDSNAELQELFMRIGLRGHTVETPSGGKLYYPPNRIYYVEAEEVED